MIPAPDSAAQIPIQAAEYVRRFGALVPYDVCPPLLPVLIAALGVAGVPEPTGYVVAVLVAWLGGSVAVYGLMRRFRPAGLAALAALLYALAPSRLPPASLESGALLVCWSLVPVLLITLESLWRKPGPRNAVAVVAVAVLVGAAHAASVDSADLVALAELAIVLAAGLAPHAAPRRVALLGFFAAAVWTVFVVPPRHASLPTRLLQDSEFDAGGSRVFGPVSLDRELNPVQAQAAAVISSPGRLEESLLWLRAMAIEFLVTGDSQKYSGALESVAEQDGWSIYRLPDPNPAPAVLVSRHIWKSLPPIRGLYDVEALNSYLSWAGRPEPAGLERVGKATFEVAADRGPLDLVLVRRNCQPGWRAYLEGESPREIPIECDPLGFMILDPGGAGEARVRLEFEPPLPRRLLGAGMPAHRLPHGDFPRITPGGVIEAVDFTPGPFTAGTLISVFGHRFVPEQTRVLFDETPGEVLWAGPRQINVRVPAGASPGEVNMVVESEGRRSFAETIEVRE
jgi:hypothetical protein